MKLVGTIESVETIAKGRGIREYAQLVTRFGGKNWVKRKGIALVEIDSQTGRAEVHWYEMPRHRQSQNESETLAMKHYALCLSNDFGADFSGDDVLPGLVYETLGEERGALRIVDESGDDFLSRQQLSRPQRCRFAIAGAQHGGAGSVARCEA